MVVALHAQTTLFVKSDATGANDGSSWANAFTSLDNALAIAVPDQEIWVAGGIYKPGTPAPGHTFLVQSGVELYGGFAGTETLLSQRNITLNVTVLSGDILDNDIVDNFSQFREDNAYHVLTVLNGEPTNRAVIDGFTIRNGNTLSATTDPDLARRGGGILAQAKVTVRNCQFQQNFAVSGAGVAALGAESSGVIIDNCVFEKNNSNSQSAGVFMRTITEGMVNRCIFRDNTTSRGCIYPNGCNNITVDSCLFQGNTAATGNWGAGFYTFNTNFILSNCEFNGNTAHNAAGVYLDGRSFLGTYGVINNCNFEANTATNYGGTGVFVNKFDFELNNCRFVDNIAPSSGAALYVGDTSNYEVNNCLFQGHTGQYAGAVANYGEDSHGFYDNCIFRSNEAVNGGGAVSNGFRVDARYNNCLFELNTADFGGAIFTQNDTTRLTVENCLFNENSVISNGGAIYVNRNIAADIDGATFFANSGDFGGVMYVVGNDSSTYVSNSIFQDNLGFTQAAGINVSNTRSLYLTNNLFVQNNNLGGGVAGAISNNAPDSTSSVVYAVNCTFADNIAGIGAGISQWEEGIGDAQLHLQNCLFENSLGTNYEIEAGAPDVFGLNGGGNMSSDATLAPYLTGAQDAHDLFNGFVDAAAYNYHLVFGPAVDGGVSLNAPLTDLEGNPRLNNAIDRGCYEFGDSKTTSVGFRTLPLQIAPNPATTFTTLNLENERNGAVEIVIWEQSGKRVRTLHADKNIEKWQFSLPIQDLPAGAYRVQVRIGASVHEAMLVVASL